MGMKKKTSNLSGSLPSDGSSMNPAEPSSNVTRSREFTAKDESSAGATVVSSKAMKNQKRSRKVDAKSQQPTTPPRSPPAPAKRPRGKGLDDTKFRPQNTASPAAVDNNNLPGAHPSNSTRSLPLDDPEIPVSPEPESRQDQGVVAPPQPMMETTDPITMPVMEVTAVAELVTPGQEMTIDEEAIRQQAERDAEERLLSNVARAEVVEGGGDSTKGDGNDPHSNRQRLILFGMGFLLLVVLAVVIAVTVSNRKEVIIAATLAPTMSPTTASPSSEPSMAPSYYTNDFCKGARELFQTDVTVSGDTRENTLDESGAACGSVRSNGLGQWFSVTGNNTWLRVHTCSEETNYDTQLSVYKGGDTLQGRHPCDEAVCVQGNDQSCGDQSYISWFATGGMDYMILVHGFRYYTGEFEMEILEENNGQCEGAFNVTQPVFGDGYGGSFTIETSLQGAAPIDSDQLPACEDGSEKPEGVGVWYWFDGRSYGDPDVYVDTFDVNFTVYKGSCGNLTCTTLTPWNYDEENEGVNHYILVYGDSTMADVNFHLTVEWESPQYFIPPVPNDYCESVTNNTDFALQPNQEGLWAWGLLGGGSARTQSCGDKVWQTSKTLWYTAIGTGRAMTVSTCPNYTADQNRTYLDTQISVFAGSCENLLCVDGNDQFCGDQSSVSWFTELGVEYFVVVHGYDGRDGFFEVWYGDADVSDSPSCQEAVTIVADGASILGRTEPVGGLQSSVSFCGFGGNSSGSWFQAMGTGETWTASTCSSDTGFTARVSVYEGLDCSNLECVPASVLSKCGDQAAVTWKTVPGQVYHILVHGTDSSSSGDFVLTLEETLSNDKCQGTIGPLSLDTEEATFGSTRSATFDNDVPPCRQDGEGRVATGRGVFYSVIGTGDNITASTCSQHTNFDMKLAVYSGSCDDLQCVQVLASDCPLREDNTAELGATVTWPSRQDELYYLMVQGVDEETGNFGLELSTFDPTLLEGDGHEGLVELASDPVFWNG